MNCLFNKIPIQQGELFVIYLMNHVLVVQQCYGQEHVDGLDIILNLPVKNSVDESQTDNSILIFQ